MLDVLQLDALEVTGAYEQALKSLRGAMRRGETTVSVDELLHRLGRLHQLLNHVECAERAYRLALIFNPKRVVSINNLAVLRMAALDYSSAESLLENGLKISHLIPQQHALLLNSSCELCLYQRRPREAALFAQTQLKISDTSRARINFGIALRYLNDLNGSLKQQGIGLKKMLDLHELTDASISHSIGRVCEEGLQKTLQTHLAIMNYAVARLSINKWDKSAQYLLLAGSAIEPFSWQVPFFFERIWRGQEVAELVLWHDQGYGDAIQNLAWVPYICKRVGRLKLLLRPSLVRLAVERLQLPSNCQVGEINLEIPPWQEAEAHMGLWFAPLALGGWSPEQPALKYAALRRLPSCRLDSSSPKIGLVWMAGRHKAPQPELAARLRDVPFPLLKERLGDWQNRFNARCFSLQLGNEHLLENDVIDEVESGRLEQPLSEKGDWLTTAEVVETMNLVITVDTAMAHLCGSLGVPCVVLLNAPCDWRWGQEGDHSFLYESVRLARCPFPDAWSKAMSVADSFVDEMFS